MEANMHITDRITYGMAFIGYLFGSLFAKILTYDLGRGSHIHFSVRYWWPSHIIIGRNCEIRYGSSLDARSRTRFSIIIGDGSRIKDYVAFATYGGNIRLGKNVLVGRCSTILGHGGVSIGDNSMLGPNTALLSGNYITYINGTPFQTQGATRESINIGENVWIGANTSILGGSHIENDVVVAAGAVVRGTLKAGWLYGGIPAKPLKQLGTNKPPEIIAYFKQWDLFTFNPE